MTTLITVYNHHAREMGQNITSSELDTPSATSRCSAFTNEPEAGSEGGPPGSATTRRSALTTTTTHEGGPGKCPP
jgi:hypothetical protein